ncbi:NAD(P)H-dependent oxidoreductase [Bacillus sp. FJAT-49732]|uniref:NAD(P)H-dependent oxidoreductase n=1 Tax=Lederbergia citrisecunda TaxID=2833583 RepID=A0A942YMF4_9BACI|nr:NAD(P)H-dependent oxidoreductase [Lederbergia citrisecunda]MBS4201602.1 NAD(P)H-dependent oxidoreductase [Lederbergia citrisecunda]
MNIVAIIGSNRKESYNKKITTFLQERYQDKLNIEILPIEKMPIYSEDEEFNPITEVKEIKNKISECDGIIIATPEYNHSIPGILKNAIDWFSRVDTVMVNKPVMIFGCSTGTLGTVRAQIHLRQILHSPGISALTLPGNEVYISSVSEKVDKSGKLIHEPTILFLDRVMKNFVEWIEKNKLATNR